MSDIEKKEYEIALLVRAESDIQNARLIMEKNGISKTFESPIKQVQLAYSISKEKSAFFCFWYGMADPSVIKEFVNELRHEAWCLRSLVVADPVKHAHYNEVRRSENDEEYANKREIKEQEAPIIQEKKVSETVTNEDLEKKLEEILS